MGVRLNEKLYIYLVVMQANSIEIESGRVTGRTTEDTSQKYFKTFSTPEAVVKLVGELKEHESVRAIHMIDDAGISYPLTITFVSGKLKLEAQPQEGTR